MLTEGNLRLTNNYLRKKGRNPNSVTLDEKKNIYNAHLKPLPIKFVQNLVNKVSKNVAIKKLVNMGFDEKRVANFLRSPQMSRQEIQKLTGYTQNKFIRLAHTAMNISTGKTVNIKNIMDSIEPMIRKIALRVGIQNESDIRKIMLIIKNLILQRYGKQTPQEQYAAGVYTGKLITDLATRYIAPPGNPNSNFTRGFKNSKAPKKILFHVIRQRLKKAI
jgi:hypothetical protein